MNVMPSLGWLVLAAAATLAAGVDVRRMPVPGMAAEDGARMGEVGSLVFPSGIWGTDPDPLRQVDEVLEKMHAILKHRGLGIGNMLQHTIFLKDGALSPMAVLTRFHASARRLAPSLKELPSVGTIIRVPELPDPRAAIMLDIVAGKPRPGTSAGQDGFTRIPFSFGPEEIAETIAGERLLFTAGTEAMDFEHGTLAEKADDQVGAVVEKLDRAARKAGLSLSQMVQHNLYLKRGTDPARVVRKFHEEMRRRDPRAKDFPGTGSLMIVDGMAGDGFLLEMDAVLTRGTPDGGAHVPFTNIPMDIAETAAAGGLVFVTAMSGADLGRSVAYAEGIEAQVDLAVRNAHDALRRAGLSLTAMVKHRLLLKKGAGDPERVRARFHEAAARLAPEIGKDFSAETFLIVEALESPAALFAVSIIAAGGRR